MQKQCPSFTLEFLDPNNKFLIGHVGNLKAYCLRGTRTPADLVADLQAVPKPMGIGTVHKGFYDRIDAILTQYPPENTTTRVLMTGHSLGGGGAHCGYLIMKAIYPQLPVVCVTFGVPCAVSEEIMHSVEEPREIVNFVDEGDYIPSITIQKYTSGRESGELNRRADSEVDECGRQRVSVHFLLLCGLFRGEQRGGGCSERALPLPSDGRLLLRRSEEEVACSCHCG